MEFLEAQSTTIKKRERSACETKLLKREKVPADTISSGSEFQIFITRLINENFVASILHMSDRILKAWPRVVLYWQNLMQFKISVLANPYIGVPYRFMVAEDKSNIQICPSQTLSLKSLVLSCFFLYFCPKILHNNFWKVFADRDWYVVYTCKYSFGFAAPHKNIFPSFYM